MKNLLLSLSLAAVAAPVIAQTPNGCDPALKAIKVGDRIINSAGALATVTAVTGPDTFQYEIDMAPISLMASRKDVAFGVQCGQSACVGDRVTNISTWEGTVKEVFSNGRMSIVFDILPAVPMVNDDNLIVSVNGYPKGARLKADELRVGSYVVTNINTYGRVTAVLSNDMIQLQSETLPFPMPVSSKDIGVAVNCNKVACAGDTVLNSSNMSGKVNYAFSNGKFLITFDLLPTVPMINLSNQIISVNGYAPQVCSENRP